MSDTELVGNGRRTGRRSKAWAYYAILGILGLIAGFTHPTAFVAAASAGLYSIYLYRGGRVVIWFW